MMATKYKLTGNPDWKGEVQQLLDEHNGTHAKRHKTISHRTRDARAEGLFRIHMLLRRAGFKVGPFSYGGRHIQFLMGYWTANPGIEEGLRARGSTLPMRTTPYSPAYIQQQLSLLRTLSSWIGKAGLVLPAKAYVSDPALVERSGIATRDRSWSGAAVDIDATIAKVYAADEIVGLQLELAMAFGLRRKEAVMFSPALAEVPAHALPGNAVAGDYLAFVCVKRGTKGGRIRYTAIRNELQREVLARAKAIAPRPNMHVGRPGMSLKQALRRFSNVLSRCGVTLEGLGVTAHGLRHQFAADIYFEMTAFPAPVKGGSPNVDIDVMNAAYLEVAHQLGHGRARITGAYLGGRRPGRRQGPDGR